MTSAVSPLESRLGYSFHSRSLLQQALTHASSNEADNERLEFLGDAVLNLIAAEMLFARFEDQAEGTLTEMKAHLVSRATVNEVAVRLGLLDEIRTGGSLGRQDSLPRSLAGNALEAVLGAIWLDAGESDRAEADALNVCRGCVDRWFGPELQSLAKGAPASIKQQLQEYAQAEQLGLPRYHHTDAYSHPRAHAFRVEVELAGQRYPGAWGSSKREAERRAAHEAWTRLAPAEDRAQ